MKKSTIKKILSCVKCNNNQIIHRKTSRNKKAGHRKGLWCTICQKKTIHIELPEFIKNCRGDLCSI